MRSSEWALIHIRTQTHREENYVNVKGEKAIYKSRRERPQKKNRLS